MCETACPQTAISRKEGEDGRFEYVVEDSLCIGCGTCAGVCPTGVWNLVANVPLE
ncbi:MAG: 4Fe-4S dicluster domain-containing protein [Syntrophobacterales bacterium]|nr:4Fe-4S dicluster domain-containing protein [Syntrophobacterales bacterium]